MAVTQRTLEEQNMDAARARRLGALVGPSLMAISASEFPFVQPHLYEQQIPPVVYLSGTLMFIAGLAIVRVHHRWVRAWTVLLTFVGYAALGLGLVRMFGAEAYRSGYTQTSPLVFMAIEAVLFAIGATITVMSYRRGPV